MKAALVAAVRPPYRFSRQFDRRETVHQRIEGNLPRHAGKRLADADVRHTTEGEMRSDRPRYVGGMMLLPGSYRSISSIACFMSSLPRGAS